MDISINAFVIVQSPTSFLNPHSAMTHQQPKVIHAGIASHQVPIPSLVTAQNESTLPSSWGEKRILLDEAIQLQEPQKSYESVVFATTRLTIIVQEVPCITFKVPDLKPLPVPLAGTLWYLLLMR
jgi:hypothetical protein